jgi:hypothetical protein
MVNRAQRLSPASPSLLTAAACVEEAANGCNRYAAYSG